MRGWGEGGPRSEGRGEDGGISLRGLERDWRLPRCRRNEKAKP